MSTKEQRIKVGDSVRVPWGLERDIAGTIVEVWGDPPTHVRVELDMGNGADADPVVILLSPAQVSAA